MVNAQPRQRQASVVLHVVSGICAMSEQRDRARDAVWRDGIENVNDGFAELPAEAV